MQKYRGIYRFGRGGDDYVTVIEGGAEYDLSVIPTPHGAFEGDEVEIFTQGELSQIFAPGSGAKRKCRIVSVTARACDVVTGEYVVSEKTPYIVPDSYIPYRIKIKGSLSSPRCSHGDKIKAVISKYKTVSAMRAEPVINFGAAGTFGANFRAAVHGTPHYAPFSSAAEKQASTTRMAEALNFLAKRRDLRGKTVFTFSDTENCPNSYAFSVTRTDGEWVLGLHVADIAEYLPPSSPLDTEAASRGRTLFSERDGSPLFPASFRNSVCNLGNERAVLAVSAFVTFDISGNVLDTELCESVIDPVLTASASDVDALLSGADSSALMPLRRKYSAIFPSVELLYELAAVLRARRVENGVDFDLCDRVFAFNTEKRVSGMSIVPRSDSALMAAELLGSVGAACAEKLYYAGAGCVYASCTERRYNEATGLPTDRFFLDPREYLRPGYTAREADAVRGTAAEHYFCACLTDELNEPELTFTPKRHYILNAEKYMRFFDPAERYSDLVNLRAIKAYVRETPFDVTRYASALAAEKEACRLRRRLTGLFSASYAAENRDKTFKGTVVKTSVGGASLVMEFGADAFLAAGAETPRVGDTVRVMIDAVDYRLGRFTVKLP